MAEHPLAEATVAIVGLGLMGGSLALALEGRCAARLGIDVDAPTLALAQARRVVESASADPACLLPQADVVVLAAPARANLALLAELPALHPGPAVVLDLSSTKVDIVQAMDRLPPRFDPLGGHPMCGKETSGLGNADPDLFRGAPFAFTPLPRTTSRARAVGEALALAVGGRPLWLEAHTHDAWVAATSHLPYLLANALAAATPSEAAPLAGPGFRSTTRLAASSPAMMLDVLTTNRVQVLCAARRFRQQLEMLEALLTSGDEAALAQALALGAACRNGILKE